MISDSILDSSVEELSRGYILYKNGFRCLVCNQTYEEGVVYPREDVLFTAERAMQEHLIHEHGGVLSFLLDLSPKHTGISKGQGQILRLLGEGKSDAEMAKELGIARSTIRNHRFRLKEKARQARMFLAMMSELDKVNQVDTFVTPHGSATMLDERYAVTVEEQNKVCKHYFNQKGRLKHFPAKEKKKLIILRAISEFFESGHSYSEQDVNSKLQDIFEDYVTLRRYLIQYGFLKREKDGSLYWKP